MNSPIFIIGNPRSGTTLLRLMLTCHRNIVIPPECGFAVWLYDKYGHWEKLEKYSNSLLMGFIRDLMCCRKIETWNVEEKNLFEFLSGRKPASYSDLVSYIYEWYGLSQGKSVKRWGDKNNFHIRHILTIKAMFPNACFMHIVRDGRDVACSYKKLSERRIDSPYAPRLPNKIEDIAEQWKTNIQIATKAFDTIEWENVYEIKFEDLILDTEMSLRNLCKQLGEEYDPSMLNYQVMNREYRLEPKEFLQWKEKTLKPPIREEAGRYRSELTGQDIHIFQTIAGKQLARYSYVRRNNLTGKFK